jgi:diguanylate cyclase (GGDEF)-like protein
MNVLLVHNQMEALFDLNLPLCLQTISITKTPYCFNALQILSDGSFDAVIIMAHDDVYKTLDNILQLKKQLRRTASAIIVLSKDQNAHLYEDYFSSGAHEVLTLNELKHAHILRAIAKAKCQYHFENQIREDLSQYEKSATLDTLTGLPDRACFDQLFNETLANQLLTNSQTALLVIDIDHFKFINEQYGYGFGDKLLVNMVHRIKNCLRGHEIFARLGSDEFAIALTHFHSIEQVHEVAKRIMQNMRRCFALQKRKINAHVSIGIALSPMDSSNANDLFKYAHIAMYRAKHAGRNQVRLFDKDMEEAFLGRYQIALELQQAIDKNAFELHFQPIFRMNKSQPIQFEALLRWHHNQAIRTPDSFIPIAEEDNSIISIGQWVIETAFAQLKQWSAKIHESIQLSINLSAVQTSHESLVPFVRYCLHKYDINPNHIQFELTKSALINNIEYHVTTVNQLADLGFKIALDDFGTDYSSLNYLQKLRIDTIKIDRSLLPDTNVDKQKILLLKGLVSLINVLGLNIICEGVETKEQMALCQKLKIPMLQGFYFAKPMDSHCLQRAYLDN